MATTVMNDTIFYSITNIQTDCIEWSQQYERYAPNEVEKRKNNALGIRELARCFLGLFIYPNFPESDELYVFQGLRNKEYMAVFNNSSVAIIGSHEERSFAKKNGHGFIWSFPMESAVRSKIYRDWNLFIVRQLLRWIDGLTKKKKVIFFLYEDTQPLGTFIVHVSRAMLGKTKTVCIQHGYFCEIKHPLRYEGKLSDYNMVWDDRQTSLTGFDPKTTFSIGLPYVARAKPSIELPIILVGVGAPYSTPDLYATAIEMFTEVARVLRAEYGRRIVYRPHPNELIYPDLVADLHQRFGAIDELDKITRLNTTRSIFIGTVSSLLYEAKKAGHLVVYMEANDLENPVFDYDFKLSMFDLTSLVHWIRNSVNQSNYQVALKELGAEASPLERFRSGAVAANLISALPN